jgi:glycine hydroxymethyltransferase
MLALLKPGDKILGMSLAAGGHLTHGAAPNLSGKWFEAIQYGVKKDTMLIDYDAVRELALTHKPKIIVAGGSAYPREIDFAKFKQIAQEVGAYFWVDMAHFAGLVAAKEHKNPLDYADLILVDLSPKKITGNVAEKTLEAAGLTCNKNSIPFDLEKPTVTSGIRLGSPAGTTRGFKEAEFRKIGNLIADVLDAIASNDENNLEKVVKSTLEEVSKLCKAFPIY